jgi:phenylacetic acid degradation operon negative regulatory protein
LILDLLSTLGRSAAPVRALVSAGGLFGIAGNALRVALARLTAEGLVESDERGRYRLGRRAAPMNERVAGWRRREERVIAWRGDWIGVLTTGRPRGGARQRRDRALRLHGLRALDPGLSLRPDNLRGGVEAARDDLRALGLREDAPVFRLADLDAATDRRARGLFDGAALGRRYRDLGERLEQSAARLPDLPREEAMAESFLLGGEALRCLVLDPLLPEPIAPVADRRALVAAMRRYDDLGRRCWRGWLGDAAAPAGPFPAGVRAQTAKGDLALVVEGI